VRNGKRGEDVVHDGDRLGRGDPAAVAQDLAKRGPWDELHHQERAVVVGALVVDRDDIGMRQPSGGAGLALEARDGLAVVAEVGVQDLDGDATLEPGAR
jgi:hypothetical protein